MTTPMHNGAADAEVTAVLLRAGEAQRLASLFVYPAPGFQARLLASLDLLSSAGAADADLPVRFGGLRRIWMSLDEEAIRAEYSRLFIGAGACSLNETGYSRGLTSAAELADIQGFYKAFGFELSAAHPDMADHLVSELEFHAALLLKLAYAMLQGSSERQEVTARAAARFLEAHLGRWMAPLADRLRAAGAAPAYLQSTEAIERFVVSECERFGAVPTLLAREPAVLPGTSEPDVFTCPMAVGCEAGQVVAPGGRRVAEEKVPTS